MRFAAYRNNQETGLATATPDGRFRGLTAGQPGFPGTLDTLIARGEAGLKAGHDALLSGEDVDLSKVSLLLPLGNPGKILCVGLNYADHSKESGFEVPSYPTIFARFTSSLIPHGAPIVRPTLSDQLDYEGEMVVVIGKPGRHIPKDRALDHVIGYSIFNEASIRDYQRKAPQWTMGKNFDGTGAFGPVFVSADALPPGGKGLRLQTRLNGQVVQDASTDDMIFDVASLVSIISDVLTLSSGDIIVSGTPSGVGMARKPPLFMKPGDICEVEIEGIGILRNPVTQE
jgi:acylpyruvate hydrolase